MRKKVKPVMIASVTKQTIHKVLYGLVTGQTKQLRTTDPSLFKKIDFTKLS
jgi:hypothetical protein